MADLPFSTSQKDQLVKLRIGEGAAAAEPKTIMQCFDKTVAANKDKPALHAKILGEGQTNENTPYNVHYTWGQYKDNVYKFAKSLISIGFADRDTINILGFNAPEWFFSNYGAIFAGGISAGIYTTNEPEACKYISEHSEAKVVVVEGVKQLEKYYSIAKDLPNLKALVMYGPDSVPADIASLVAVPVYSFADFLKLGETVSDSDLQARIDDQKPNGVTTLIYTSGTTGPPKAVMVTHDNITWTATTQLATMPNLGNSDRIISYLPLSHIAAQLLDIHCPLMTGTQCFFAMPDALRGSIGVTLKEVKPTVFFGVPRVWEKIYDKMQIVAKSTKGLKKKIGAFAKKRAAGHWQAHQYGGSKKSPRFYGLSQKILGKIKQALGLEECIAFYVSAAPIEVKILEYFASIDIPILEVFGQSECTGPHTSNTYPAWKIGSVGRPLPGTVTKTDPETGELIYSGRHVFAGYLNMEDKTKETIDPEGFLHSGDVVSIDDSLQNGEPNTGFVNITGRIKELIITAGGENVPPVLIEEAMKSQMSALSNCMTIGDKRKFLSILFCLHVEIDEETGIPTNKLTGPALETSKAIGSPATTSDEARDCEKWKQYFDDGLAKGNALATSRAQKVGKWTLLSKDFTEPSGELTPTLKLKRSVVADKYSAEIEAMYA